MNNFFEKEKRESNFRVDYKGNVCKVSFSESEKAFSLIIYLTKLKKNNPIFKRLKINLDYKLTAIVTVKKLRKPIKLILPLINKNSSKTIDNNKSSFNMKILKSISQKSNSFKSRNDKNMNMIFNSMENNNKKKFASEISNGDKKIINSESKLIKNKLKNYDSSLENFKQAKNFIKSRNILESYAFNFNQNGNLDNKDNLSDHSEEIKPKFGKLRSTNFILDLSNIKKRNTVKNSLIFKSQEEIGKTPQIKPIKRSNYYSIFVNNLSKKYKDINLLKSQEQKISYEDED